MTAEGADFISSVGAGVGGGRKQMGPSRGQAGRELNQVVFV